MNTLHEFLVDRTLFIVVRVFARTKGTLQGTSFSVESIKTRMTKGFLF